MFWPLPPVCALAPGPAGSFMLDAASICELFIPPLVCAKAEGAAQANKAAAAINSPFDGLMEALPRLKIVGNRSRAKYTCT